MPRYLVRIEAAIEVEADDETEAETTAAECFDFGSVDFDVEEIDDSTDDEKETTNDQFWDWMAQCPVSSSRLDTDVEPDQKIHVFGFVVPISEEESAQ